MTHVTVTSAIKLSSEQSTRIQDAVEKKHGAAKFEFAVNPSILGGVVVTINSQQIDGSIKTKLSKIKQELQQRIISE